MRQRVDTEAEGKVQVHWGVGVAKREGRGWRQGGMAGERARPGVVTLVSVNTVVISKNIRHVLEVD